MRRRSKQAANDVANNVGSLAILIFGTVVFLAGAIGGLSIIGRLGTAGWVMYGLVIGTYALVFGPVLASAVTLRQKGSPRHRAALEKRRAEQREHFGLNLRDERVARERDERERGGETP